VSQKLPTSMGATGTVPRWRPLAAVGSCSLKLRHTPLLLLLLLHSPLTLRAALARRHQPHLLLAPPCSQPARLAAAQEPSWLRPPQ
jgi:hypothetical protein